MSQPSIVLYPSGDTTGTTDSTNFSAAIALFIANLRADYSGNGVIQLGAGAFYINTSNAFLVGNAHQTYGMLIQGSGVGITIVNYLPTVSGPMCTNTCYVGMRIRDMTFYGQDSNSNFLNSTESTGKYVQWTTFENIEWKGTWADVILLAGSNNNSEWGFKNCSVSCTSIQNWIHSPAGGADQFLNFWFHQCKFWPTQGAWLQLNKGGSVGITDCDSSGWGPSAQVVFTGGITSNVLTIGTGGVTAGTLAIGMIISGAGVFPGTAITGLLSGTGQAAGSTWNVQTSTAPSQSVPANTAMTVGTFMFNLQNPNAAQGVCSFKVDKLRIEVHSDYAYLINSTWTEGNISFNQVDQSSITQTASDVQASFLFSNESGPIVKFSNSNLLGRHSYWTYGNNYNYCSSVVYDQCILLQNPDPSNFAVCTSGGNSGGIVAPRFMGSITPGSSSGTYKYINDCDLNWRYTKAGITHTKIASLSSTNSDMVTGGSTNLFRIPLGAIITRIRLFKPAGAGLTGAFDYKIQSTEATPTLLAEIAGTDPNALLWFDTELKLSTGCSIAAAPIYFPLTNDLKRTIAVVDNAARTGVFTGQIFELHYIG